MLRTLEPFFISPSNGQYLADISRQIGLAHTSVKKNLEKLVKLSVIGKSTEKKGKRAFPIYRANATSKLFRTYKMVYNITCILESGIIKFIAQKLMPKAIVLFGSYRRGEDIEASDIDLFIECKKEELDLKTFEKKLGRKIGLHFNENFTSYSKELKNNIINGIVLEGFLEGYK
jgi:predicted nucleotidyltransferase